MSNLTKKDAAGILSSRTPISTPGKYSVKVTNCGDYNKDLGNGQHQVAIANFNAMTPYQQAEARKLMIAGDLRGATNQGLSISIRSNDYRPSQGEIVDIEVGFVKTKSGEQALLVTSLTPRKAESISAKCDFSEFLDEVEESVEATADESELS